MILPSVTLRNSTLRYFHSFKKDKEILKKEGNLTMTKLTQSILNTINSHLNHQLTQLVSC